jgi:hypothetical protein
VGFTAINHPQVISDHPSVDGSFMASAFPHYLDLVRGNLLPMLAKIVSGCNKASSFFCNALSYLFDGFNPLKNISQSG